MAQNLAIFGGKKTIENPAPHYTWPQIDKQTEEAVIKQLHSSISIYDRSGAIEELEEKLRKVYGVKHALLFNSGTMALYTMYLGTGIKEGDEVICPAYTFYATATPLFFLGAIPVLADCKEDGNINVKEIEKKITKKTKAIVVTHMWGVPCQMDEITSLAKKHDLVLLEDGSHAHFAEYNNKKVGTFGDASAFSLQGQKTLSGGEGGFILTDNDEIFYKALLLGHYNKRCKKEIPQDYPLSEFSITGMGLKLRIHPLACAIVLDQLNKIQNILEGRNYFYNKIATELSKLPGLEIIPLPQYSKPTWYALVIKYKPEELGGLSREKFYESLKAEGCIELDIPNSTAPLNLYPLFQEPEKLFPGYKGNVKYKRGDFPQAEKFYNCALKLPVWHRAEDEEIANKYILAFKKVINFYKSAMVDNDLINKITAKAKKDGIQKFVVGAVILNKEGKFLLLNRPADDFMGGINELPSGKLEEGEGLLDALKREVKEETNLDVEKVIKYIDSFDYISGSGKKVRQFNFLINVKDGEIKLTEHDGFVWSIQGDEAFEKLSKETKEIIVKINS